MFVCLLTSNRCSQIVHTVLSDPEMAAEWRDELKIMSGRIQAMRKVLYDELVRLGEDSVCFSPYCYA